MKYTMGLLPQFDFNENLWGNFDDTHSAHCLENISYSRTSITNVTKVANDHFYR